MRLPGGPISPTICGKKLSPCAAPSTDINKNDVGPQSPRQLRSGAVFIFSTIENPPGPQSEWPPAGRSEWPVGSASG
jgi:hypothetical protein